MNIKKDEIAGTQQQQNLTGIKLNNMYFYNLNNYNNEQAQLLEMRSHAFIFDGIGCNGVKQNSQTNTVKCGQAFCSHFFIS